MQDSGLHTLLSIKYSSFNHLGCLSLTPSYNRLVFVAVEVTLLRKKGPELVFLFRTEMDLKWQCTRALKETGVIVLEQCSQEYTFTHVRLTV